MAPPSLAAAGLLEHAGSQTRADAPSTRESVLTGDRMARECTEDRRGANGERTRRDRGPCRLGEHSSRRRRGAAAARRYFFASTPASTPESTTPPSMGQVPFCSYVTSSWLHWALLSSPDMAVSRQLD